MIQELRREANERQRVNESEKQAAVKKAYNDAYESLMKERSTNDKALHDQLNHLKHDKDTLSLELQSKDAQIETLKQQLQEMHAKLLQAEAALQSQKPSQSVKSQQQRNEEDSFLNVNQSPSGGADFVGLKSGSADPKTRQDHQVIRGDFFSNDI